jgi:hypothetical protein
MGWKALSKLSFRASVEVRLSIGTAAGEAAGQRQNEGSRGALQRRNRPLSHVPVGAFRPKAVQWSNEEQVKAVLTPFCPYVGSTPSRLSSTGKEQGEGFILVDATESVANLKVKVAFRKGGSCNCGGFFWDWRNGLGFHGHNAPL